MHEILYIFPTVKVNALQTLIHTSYKLSFNYLYFSEEVNFLCNMVRTSGFPTNLLEAKIAKYIKDLFPPK